MNAVYLLIDSNLYIYIPYEVLVSWLSSLKSVHISNLFFFNIVWLSKQYNKRPCKYYFDTRK